MTGNPKESQWYSTPATARKRKPIALTLSEVARKRLKKLADANDESLSATVERLILEATKKRTK